MSVRGGKRKKNGMAGRECNIIGTGLIVAGLIVAVIILCSLLVLPGVLASICTM